MSELREVVIAVHNEFTQMHAVAVDLQGNLLAHKNIQAEQSHNFQSAPFTKEIIHEVLSALIDVAGATLTDIHAIVVGWPRIHYVPDRSQLNALFTLDGFEQAPVYVDGLRMTHAAILGNRPGLAAAELVYHPVYRWTTIIAVTDSGRVVTSQEFGQYALASKESISRDILHRIIAGRATHITPSLLTRILEHWSAREQDELIPRLMVEQLEQPTQPDPRFESMAPLVLDAAVEGDPVCLAVCQEAIEEFLLSIRVLSKLIDASDISMAMKAPLFEHDGFRSLIQEQIASKFDRIVVSNSMLSPIGGLALIGLAEAGCNSGNEVIEQLRSHPLCLP